MQEKVTKSFIPLKLTIKPGTKQFPLDWPAMGSWKVSYQVMGGEKCEGITACSVVSPDLKVEYGNTGSAFVWELFDSTAYDAKKFAAMLDRAAERGAREQRILADKKLSDEDRERQLMAFRGEVRTAVAKEGEFHLPPKGITIEGATELFRISGDLPQK